MAGHDTGQNRPKHQINYKPLQDSEDRQLQSRSPTLLTLFYDRQEAVKTTLQGGKTASLTIPAPTTVPTQ